jgi:hypothetical protein
MLRQGLQLRVHEITASVASRMSLLRCYSLPRAHSPRYEQGIFLDGAVVGYYKFDSDALELRVDVWNIKTDAHVSRQLILEEVSPY